MAFVCTKNNCKTCTHSRVDEESGRKFCFVKQDGPTKEEKEDDDFMANLMLADYIPTDNRVLLRYALKMGVN